MTKLNNFFERVFRRDIALPPPDEDGETRRLLEARLGQKLTIPFFGVMFLLFGGLFAFHVGQMGSSAETTPPPQEFVETPAPEETPKGLEALIPPSLLSLENRCQQGDVSVNTYKLKAKESFESLLKRAGVAPEKQKEILESFTTLATPKNGESFYVFTDKEGHFLGIVAYKGEQTLGVVEQEDGTCLPVSHTVPIEKSVRRIQGEIERTFSGSVKKAGLPAELVSSIRNALTGEVDFYSDFHKGDTFDILYECDLTPSGLEIGDKKVRFVGLKMGKRTLYRYAYQGKNGITSFYSPAGASGAKTLLKRPVQARTRVSSPYGNRRHPILGYTIFHHGVDLAAPKNSPIVAAGDGIVTFIGRRGGYGKYIKIKHKDGYETAYGHMNGYRKNLKKGSAVKQGDVIGYVGSTGRSTGPHLHFEVLKGGKTVQPLNTHVIAGAQLTGKDLDSFQEQAKALHPDYMKHLIGKTAPVPVRRPSLKG